MRPGGRVLASTSRESLLEGSCVSSLIVWRQRARHHADVNKLIQALFQTDLGIHPVPTPKAATGPVGVLHVVSHPPYQPALTSLMATTRYFSY